MGGIGRQIDGGNFNNVVVNDIEKLITSGNDSKTGGFTGKVIGDPGISVNNNFSNIYVYHNLENGYIDEGQNFLSLCNIIMK